jgi:hypothetical protein
MSSYRTEADMTYFSYSYILVPYESKSPLSSSILIGSLLTSTTRISLSFHLFYTTFMWFSICIEGREFMGTWELSLLELEDA